MELPVRRWAVRGGILTNDEHTLLMGIVNVTPDSFFDGGRYLDHRPAVELGLALHHHGADLVDVGGESTRPGAEPVSVEEELSRVGPVVDELARHGVLVSIDTAKAKVADAALRAGAVAVNDVTALSDPEMAGVVAEHGAGVVLMHMQGTPRTMQLDPRYGDVVGEVRDFLLERAEVARAAGIHEEYICIDPGIGFGKNLRHNLLLLAHLDELVGTGHPVLIGTSRKSFIGALLDGVPPEERLEGTGATLALAIVRGVTLLRVHDVTAAVHVARVADAIFRVNSMTGWAWRD